MQIIADTIEQSLTAAEERRHEIDFHFVHKSGGEILPGGSRTAAQRHVLATGGLPCPLERRLYAVGDENKCRPSFELERLTCVVRENEHRVMERRIGSPPAVPWILGVPRARVPAKHVAPHDRSADAGERLLDDRAAFVDLATLQAMERTELRELEGPLMQASATDSERVLHALAGTGDKAIERHRDSKTQQDYSSGSFFAGAWSSSITRSRRTRSSSISSRPIRARPMDSRPIASAPMANAPIATAPNANAPRAFDPATSFGNLRLRRRSSEARTRIVMKEYSKRRFRFGQRGLTTV